MLSVLWRTWKVTCPILCYLCYRGHGGLVVLYLLSMLLRTWKVICPVLCYLCDRGAGILVVLYLVINVIEDLEG
jgi:hypothetical protein